jgi:ribonuclease R
LKKKKHPARSEFQLDKARVLEALAKNPQSTKRDIAHTLGVKGNARIHLKKILKELESEGALKRGPNRTFEKPGTLPDITVLEITGQDADGELLARPQRWDSDKQPPKIIVLPG